MVIISASAVPAVVITVVRSRPGPDVYRCIIPGRRIPGNRIVPYGSIIIRITERKGDGERSVTAVVIIASSPVPRIIIGIDRCGIDRIIKVSHTHRRIREHPDTRTVGDYRCIKGGTYVK
jgi:hypothetical protein